MLRCNTNRIGLLRSRAFDATVGLATLRNKFTAAAATTVVVVVAVVVAVVVVVVGLGCSMQETGFCSPVVVVGCQKLLLVVGSWSLCC